MREVRSWDTMTATDPSSPAAATQLVLVNGLPGAGKSTLAAAFARAWDAARYSKHSLKDFLAESSARETDAGWLSRVAEDLLWFLAARRSRVVVETWFGSADRASAVRTRLDAAGIDPERAVEVWCEVPMTVARDRLLTRARDDAARHSRHLQEGADPAWWDSLLGVGPLGLTRVVRVDTGVPLSGDRVHELLRDVTTSVPR